VKLAWNPSPRWNALTSIGQYLQSGGGKRLRPILVLLCGKMFGPATPGLIRIAAVMEMIHTATLVHDDVIDMAKTRRGVRRSMSSGATIPRFWRATGCICRRFT
jgi:geranylgeranyl pyrophosphate synthase